MRFTFKWEMKRVEKSCEIVSRKISELKKVKDCLEKNSWVEKSCDLKKHFAAIYPPWKPSFLPLLRPFLAIFARFKRDFGLKKIKKRRFRGGFLDP